MLICARLEDGNGSYTGNLDGVDLWRSQVGCQWEKIAIAWVKIPAIDILTELKQR